MANTISNVTARKLAKARAEPKPQPWNALVAELGDGHRVVVGRAAIEKDYAEYLIQVEGITMGHATEKARDPSANYDVEVWAREQLNRSDLETMGTVLSLPSYETLLAGIARGHDIDIKFVTL